MDSKWELISRLEIKTAGTAHSDATKPIIHLVGVPENSEMHFAHTPYPVFFRSIVVERDKATTSVDLFGQGPGKAVEWQLFKTQNPISGYNAVDGTEWHGTVGRAQQVATIAHNWDATTWAVNGPAVQLGDIKIGQNGSLGKNDVAKPVQNRGVQGDTVGGQFNSRMAVYEWLKSLL